MSEHKFNGANTKNTAFTDTGVASAQTNFLKIVHRDLIQPRASLPWSESFMEGKGLEEKSQSFKEACRKSQWFE